MTSEFTIWALIKATALLLLILVAATGAVAFVCVAAGLPYVP